MISKWRKYSGRQGSRAALFLSLVSRDCNSIKNGHMGRTKNREFPSNYNPNSSFRSFPNSSAFRINVLEMDRDWGGPRDADREFS